MGLIKKFKDYFTGGILKLDNLEVGDSVQFKDTTDLLDNKLKALGALGIKPNDNSMISIKQAVSDLPELAGMVFEIDLEEKTIKRIK